MSRRDHWEGIYRRTPATGVSWYQAEARVSLDLIAHVANTRGTRIIDVGGGASTLVDGLLDAGYEAVTVLDLAAEALALARRRLGTRASLVAWMAADILDAPLARAAYDLWHDRAVFHFLTDLSERAHYVAQVRRAVRPGGTVIIGSFADDGPTRCSGLEVSRYTSHAMLAAFGAGFHLLESVREEHRTPAGVTQAFLYCACRVEGAGRIAMSP